MAKYVAFFSLTSDALARFIESPTDRRGPVSKLAEAAGGKLEAYYWMFGHHDGLAIFDMPNSASTAALSLAVSGTGAFKHVETHELVEASDLVGILQKAKSIKGSYQAPGQAR